jgi:hypothetical protein
VVVRLLAEQSKIFQPLTVGPGRDTEFDAGQQAASPYLLDVRVADLPQLIKQPRSEFRRAIR